MIGVTQPRLVRRLGASVAVGDVVRDSTGDERRVVRIFRAGLARVLVDERGDCLIVGDNTELEVRE